MKKWKCRRAWIIAVFLVLFFCYSAEVFAETIVLSQNSADDVVLSAEGVILEVPANTTVELSGCVVGQGSLTKSGGGVLVLSDAEIDFPELNITEGTVVLAGGQLENLHFINIRGAAAALRFEGAPNETLIADNIVINIYDGGLLETTNGGLVLGHDLDTYAIINVRGAGSRFICPGALFVVGFKGVGMVNLSDGGQMYLDSNNPEANAYWGYELNSYGALNLSGSDSALYVASDQMTMHMGYVGRAYLNISGGGRLVTAGALQVGSLNSEPAQVLLTDKDTLLLCNGLVVGGHSETVALLEVLAGAKLISTGSISVNGQDELTYIKVAGADTLLYCEDSLWLGNACYGAFYLEDSAQAFTGFNVVLGSNDEENGRGYLMLDGPGTRLYCDNHFYISSREPAAAHVTNGAALQILGDLAIGRFAGESAAVYVSGPEALLLSNYLSVGCGGSGLLNVSAGGKVRISRGISLGQSNTDDGVHVVVEDAGSNVSSPAFKGCVNGTQGRIVEHNGGSYHETNYEAFKLEMDTAMQWARTLTAEVIYPLTELP